MPSPNQNVDPKEIERQLFESRQFAEELLPQTADEIREAQEMFGMTPITMPESLRSPQAMLERIKEREQSQPEPQQSLGRLLTILRTEKHLSIESLAAKTELDPEELRQIESDPTYIPKPLTVSTLARHFKLQPKKLAQVASLTRRSADQICDGSFQFAACANPNFDRLSSEEKKAFFKFVDDLRKSS